MSTRRSPSEPEAPPRAHTPSDVCRALLIARSDMIATLMEGVAEASGWRNALTVFPPPLDLAPVPFVMSWHKRNEDHPAQRWLSESITSLFSKR